MAQHNELGRRGEQEACYYLAERDIHIIERNWRGDGGEVDIIADDYGMIIFVEVKTRSRTDYEAPEEAVDARRMYRLSRAAEEYLWRNGLEKNPYRFDIIAVEGEAPPFRIRHIVNAFDFRPKRHADAPNFLH